MKTAVQVPVIESERGWGQRVDDHMVCLTVEDAKAFIKEFNAKNNEPSVPDWYMYAEDSTKAIDINDDQYKKLKKLKRMWRSQLLQVGKI